MDIEERGRNAYFGHRRPGEGGVKELGTLERHYVTILYIRSALVSDY